MKEKTFKIISYCGIPQELTESHYISEYQNGCYCPFSLATKGTCKLSDWIRNKYPELEGVEFLIDVDY